jgi:hypothetical protein
LKNPIAVALMLVDQGGDERYVEKKKAWNNNEVFIPIRLSGIG